MAELQGTDPRQHLAASGIIWRETLEIQENQPQLAILKSALSNSQVAIFWSWQHLPASGSIWQQLAPSGNIWQHVAASARMRLGMHGFLHGFATRNLVLRGMEFSLENPKKKCFGWFPGQAASGWEYIIN